MVLIIVPFFRELLGSGTLFDKQVIPDSFYKMGYVHNAMMLLPPMALITLGIYIWVQRSMYPQLTDKD